MCILCLITWLATCNCKSPMSNFVVISYAGLFAVKAGIQWMVHEVMSAWDICRRPQRDAAQCTAPDGTQWGKRSECLSYMLEICQDAKRGWPGHILSTTTGTWQRSLSSCRRCCSTEVELVPFGPFMSLSFSHLLPNWSWQG